jgi:predicted LPLAT superfamily acyltransferase
MSAYMVNKVCHKVGHDDAFRVALDKDPEATLAAFDLTDEERGLLLAGEVGRLYEMGAHPYLLGHLTRHETLGITVQAFSDRMVKARDDRLPPLEAATYLTAT